MKHLKVTSVVLSIAICMSMFMPTVSVLADEAAAPSETQITQETEKQTPKETEKPAPKTTEKKETEPSEKKETEVTEKPAAQETEKQETAETEKKAPTETAEEQKPSESENTTPAETEDKRPEETGKQPETTESQEPSETEAEESVATEAPVQETEVKKGAKDVAEGGNCGPKLTWTYIDGVLEISGSGEMTSHPWTSNYKTSITKVIIGSGAKTIVDYAFDGCKNLATVDLSSASALFNIGQWSFRNCTSLTSMNIPSGVSFVDQGAFYGCTNLKSVKLNGNMGLITYDVFENCSSLTDINIPSQVDTINYAAFKGCSSLEKLTLPSTVKTIGQEAFSGCTKLSQINIPSNVSDISDDVFSGCASLTTITLSENVTRIGNSAFDGCSKLKSVTLPKSLKIIWRRAFANCSALADVYYLGTDEEWNSVEIYVENAPLFNATFHSQGSSAFTGDSGSCGTGIAWTLSKDGTLTISGSGAMDDFESNSYGSGSTAIYFYQAPWNKYKDKVTKVVFDGNITYIGSGSFNGCINLTSISLPKSLTSIGRDVFTNSGITSIIIPSGMTSIPANAFNCCVNLKTVTLPSTVKTIGKMAFANCLNLSTVNISNGVTTIGESAFEKCTALKSISLPSSVTMIGRYAFNSSGLTEVTIPGNVSSFGMFAFVKCSSLTSVIISSGVSEIGSNAFSQCDKLTNLTIPSSLYEMSSAFIGSNNIKNIFYEGSKGDWENLLYSCDGVDELYNATVTYNNSGATRYRVVLGTHTGGSVTFDPSTAVAGQTVTINATPDTGYVYDHFVLDGYRKTGNTFVMPAKNVEVDVVFVAKKFSITVEHSSGGTANCAISTAGVGGEVIINCTPNDGYVFGYMTVNGVKYTTNSFTMPAEDVNVYVTFVEGGYPIILTTDGNGTATLNKEMANPGDVITVTPKPSTGYEFDKITVNGKAYGSGVTEFTMGSASTTVEVSFKKKQYKINVSVPNGGGTASADPATAGINDKVTVNYSPNTGYTLDKIVVDGTALTSGTTSFTMTAKETNVVVSFKKVSYSVSVSVKPGDHGSAKVDKTTANYGDTITVTATPEEGYAVNTITVYNSPVTGNTFTMGAADTVVYVTFKKAQLAVNVSVPNGGGTASADPTDAEVGETIKVSYNPDTGYELDKIVVNGTALTSGTTSFEMPAKDANVTVHFKKINYKVSLKTVVNGTAKISKTTANYQDTVTVTPTPNDGYVFDKILVNDKALTSGVTEFTMSNTDTTVEVLFKKLQYSIEVSVPEGGGTATANPTNAGVGETINIQCVPDTGYELDKIIVYGYALDGTSFTMEPTNTSVVVSFKKINYQVTVTSGSNGDAKVDKPLANYGDKVTVIPTPAEGYVLDTITVDNKALPSGTTYFTMADGDATVHVTFKKAQYKITVSAPNGGGTASASADKADAGDLITVDYTAEKGYELDKIKVNGKEITTGVTFEMPAKDTTVEVSFKKTAYKVTVNSPVGGTAKLNKTSAYYKDEITVTATPSTGYELDSIKVNGEAITGYNFEMPAETTNVVVEFRKIDFKVTVEPVENGTVKVDKPTANYGDKVTITATPETGYVLENIKVNGTAITGTSFDMPAKTTTVTVTFKKVIYTLELNTPTGGTAKLSATSANYNDKITVTTTPSTGYEFDYIKINDAKLSANTFNMPAENVLITVVFKKIGYAVKVTYGDHGSAAVDKNPANYNDTVIITASPDKGYTVATVTVNDKPLDQNVMEFTMGAEPVNVHVAFKQAQYTVYLSVPDGNGTASAVPMANAGDEITVSTKPDTGYELDYIELDGKKITGRSFTMGAGSVDVKVYFKKSVYTLSVNKPTGGTATLSATKASYGDPITVTAKASTGYEFDSITVNNEKIDNAKYTMKPGDNSVEVAFTMPAENISVAVTFKKIDYTITVKQNEHGNTIVSKDTANYGEKITITAEPEEGYTVDTIKVGGSAQSTYTFTVTGNVSVEVTYKKIQYSITVKPSAGGKASADPATAGYGDNVFINISPDNGYEVDYITLDGAPTEQAFQMPNKNVVVNVFFKKTDFKIEVAPDTHGEAWVTKNSANVGDTIEVMTKPFAGYELDHISVYGNPITGNKFTMEARWTPVEVYFKLKNLGVKVTPLTGGSATADMTTAKMGDTVKLTVTPDAGYELDYIMVNDSKQTKTSFVMGSEDIEVYVAFKKINYAVMFSYEGNGTASINTDSAVIGDQIVVETYPDENYYAVIKVDGEEIGNNTFSMPANSIKVTVSFEKVKPLDVGESAKVGNAEYTVTSVAPENGVGTVRLDKITDDGTAAVVIRDEVMIKGNKYRITSVSNYAISNNQSMTSLTIGNYVISMGNFAVYGCRNLVRVSGGLRLKTIGTKAFAGCPKLKSFSISSAVLAKISAYTFYGDKSLKTIYINKTTKLTKKGVKKSLKGSKIKTVKVKKAKVKKYKKFFSKKNCGRKVKVKK